MSLLLGLLGGTLLGLNGCAQRTIHITSEPSGALVRLNDQEVGRTPLSVGFTWYGLYDVRLKRTGYETLWTQRRARAPLWDYPGPDLIFEMIPGARVDIEWHFELDKRQPPSDEELLDRAFRMRQRLEGGS